MNSRKDSILQSIIEEFIDSASPVGSKNLAEFLGFSPATIRSEMAKLEKEGLITQPHTSAGRIPTEKGYRHYIDGTDWDGELSDYMEIEKIISSQKEIEKILKLISSSSGGATAFCVTPVFVKFFGLSETLAQKDFSDQKKAVRFAKIIDNLTGFVRSLEFEKTLKVKTYIGEENPYKYAKDFSTVVVCFPLGSQPCILGVVGPLRMSYKNIIPLLTRLSKALSQNKLLKGPTESVYKDIYWAGE